MSLDARRQAALSKLLLDHFPKGELATGEVMCKCGLACGSERAYAGHLSQCLMDAFHTVLERERTEAQISLLAAISRYWHPSPPTPSARSRSVYTGAQFAGWCRERAQALSRSLSGLSKPPTTKD